MISRQFNCKCTAGKTLLGTMLLCLAALVADAEAGKDRFPDFPLVEEAVRHHLEGLDTYQPKGLISRGDVKPIFKELETMGWKVADRKEILDRLLPDNNYIVKLLRTKRGKWFASKICVYPNAYDRFDRMARMPYGQNACIRLVHHPRGYIMLRYMTQASGGEILGTYLENTATGRDFNKPTGRIYTIAALITTLKKSYEEAKRERR